MERSFPLRSPFESILCLERGYGSPSCQVLRGALCPCLATLFPGTPSHAVPSRAPRGVPLCPKSLHQHSQGSLETHGVSFLPHVTAPRQGVLLPSRRFPLLPLSLRNITPVLGQVTDTRGVTSTPCLHPTPASPWLSLGSKLLPKIDESVSLQLGYFLGFMSISSLAPPRANLFSNSKTED